MKSNITLLTFVMILFTQALFAQNHFCGMQHDDMVEVKRQMLENREAMKDYAFDRGDVTYVPIRFFLVADADGNGRGTEFSCLVALCNLNNAFEDMDIQFYLKEFKYINNDWIYDDPQGWTGTQAIRNQCKYNALNLFVVNEIDGQSNGVILAYYQPPAGPNANYDYVVSRKSSLGDPRVLTHEIGHYFSLPHTFFGWEPQPWDAAINGNPVTQYWAPNGSTIVELVDGSNCNIAADAICDTPADYLFGPSNSCTYDPVCMDKNNDVLMPQIDNYMNYFDGCSEYFFTVQQEQEINNSLFSNNRNYIRPNYTPNTSEITEQPEEIFPENNQQLDYYNNVTLTWTDVGADYYIIDMFSGPTSFRRVVSTNSVTWVDELSPDKSYFWKILAFNEGYTCQSFTGLIKFRTGENTTDVNEIDEVTTWSIVPNPVKASQNLQINVNADEAFEANIAMVSLTGQVLNQVDYEFPSGNSTYELPVNAIPSGVYMVVVRSERGVLNRRVVVSK